MIFGTIAVAFVDHQTDLRNGRCAPAPVAGAAATAAPAAAATMMTPPFPRGLVAGRR